MLVDEKRERKKKRKEDDDDDDKVNMMIKQSGKDRFYPHIHTHLMCIARSAYKATR